jgi:hypothetical protein
VTSIPDISKLGVDHSDPLYFDGMANLRSEHIIDERHDPQAFEFFSQQVGEIFEEHLDTSASGGLPPFAEA